MWRALFIAAGLAMAILGAEFMLIDKAVLTMPNDKSEQSHMFAAPPPLFTTREYVPPEWTPWTLISVGAIVVMYTSAMAKR